MEYQAIADPVKQADADTATLREALERRSRRLLSSDCVFCGGIRTFGGKPCPCCNDPQS